MIVFVYTGPCTEKQQQETPVLGGKEVGSEPYPEHGSIKVEKLPLGTESVIWSRGDGIRMPESSPDRKKIRMIGNPKSVSSLFFS